jgi:hypothetical protein
MCDELRRPQKGNAFPADRGNRNHQRGPPFDAKNQLNRLAEAPRIND